MVHEVGKVARNARHLGEQPRPLLRRERVEFVEQRRQVVDAADPDRVVDEEEADEGWGRGPLSPPLPVAHKPAQVGAAVQERLQTQQQIEPLGDGAGGRASDEQLEENESFDLLRTAASVWSCRGVGGKWLRRRRFRSSAADVTPSPFAGGDWFDP